MNLIKLVVCLGKYGMKKAPKGEIQWGLADDGRIERLAGDYTKTEEPQVIEIADISSFDVYPCSSFSPHMSFDDDGTLVDSNGVNSH